jgi:Transcriptional repressor TCF25
MEEPEEEEQTAVSAEEPPSIPPSKVASSQPTSTKKSKNKKKKRKPKDESPAPTTPSDRPTTPSTSDLDDIDRAIKEISLKYHDTPPSPSTTPSAARKHSLLSVSAKHLDADLELRKLFGKVVDAEARESRRQPIHGLSPRVVNRIKAAQKERKRTLMKPKDEWQLFAAYNKQMLSMDIVGKEDGVTRFKFVHSRRYQDVQMQFFITALGGDGNVLIELLREHPFHVDTWYRSSSMGLMIVFKLVRF